jgi:predicted GIY-YIG superfamily endonuclease
MANGEPSAKPLRTLADDPSASTLLPAVPSERTSSPSPDPRYLTPLPNPSRSKRGARSRSSSAVPYLRRTRKANKSTFLYRFYDAAGVLLYVGVTDNLAERTWSHARASTWMEFAVRSTIERYAKRTEAEEMEVAAIRGEGPLFNLAHNDDRDADRRVVDYLIKHDRRDLLAPAVSRG